MSSSFDQESVDPLLRLSRRHHEQVNARIPRGRLLLPRLRWSHSWLLPHQRTAGKSHTNNYQCRLQSPIDGVSLDWYAINTLPLSNNLDANMIIAGVVNAIFVFIGFLLSIPALAMPQNRTFLKLQAWTVIFCSFFTLVLGLFIWFDTLQTRKNLSVIWGQQSMSVQALLQERFQCCGYLNSVTPPFIVDSVCPDSMTAAAKQGCVGPFSSFANVYLDLVFTAAFGIVGLDVLLLLCVAMVLKHRDEQDRYRHIDEKINGF